MIRFSSLFCQLLLFHRHSSISIPSIDLTLSHPDYKCFEKDDRPVDIAEIFENSCVDKHENKFKAGDVLTSCCHCFKYTCTAFANVLQKDLYFWNQTVSSECCLHCDDTVYKADSIIDTVVRDDECKTIETSVCRNLPGFDEATVEVEFEYKTCCYDEDGLVPLGSSKLEKSSCSERICLYSEALPHSTWILKQVLDGCGCCEVDEKLVKDGYLWTVGNETLECCRGEIVKRIKEASSLIQSTNQPSTASTPPTTDTTSTSTTATPSTSTSTTSTTSTSTMTTTEKVKVFSDNFGSETTSTTTPQLPPLAEICNEGYKSHGLNCYKFVDQKISWDEAEAKCIAEGGHLASVPDEETNSFLVSIAPKRSFIGGYKKSDNTWAWSDGSSWSFSKWHTGEPNNHRGNEEVVELIGATWYDVPKNHGFDRGFICQQSPCYKYHHKSEALACYDSYAFKGQDFCDGSVADCSKKGQEHCSKDPKCFGYQIHEGWTASAKSPVFCKSPPSFKPEKDWNVWMKSKCEESTTTTTTTPTTTIIPGNNTLLDTISNWGKHFRVSFDLKINSLTNMDPYGYSSLLHFTNDGFGQRIPAFFLHSSKNLHVVTNIGNNVHYKKNVQLQLGQWYKIEVSQSLEAGKTYFTVEIDGKTMDRIINPTPREFSNVNVYSGLTSPSYYIPPAVAVIRNLHYESIPQTTTVSSTTVTSTTTTTTTTTKTTTTPTTTTTAYVSSTSTTTTTTTTATTTTPPPAPTDICKEGYKYFPHSGKCYKYEGTKTSWASANASCQSTGGHLASVPDQETNDFLDSLSSVYTWLGGYRLEVEGSEWGWTDGSEWNYTNWAPGKPDTLIQRSVAMYSNGQWDDGTAATSQPYICQQSPCYKYHHKSEALACYDSYAFKGQDFCDGSVADCSKKGEEHCSKDPKCFGYQIHEGWTASAKSPVFCKSPPAFKPEKDWNVWMKSKCEESTTTTTTTPTTTIIPGNNTLLDTISKWGKHFRVSFDLKINSVTNMNQYGYSSLLHFTNDNTKICCAFGTRIPAFYLHSNKILHIATNIGNNGNYHKNFQLQLGQWYKIEVSQSFEDGKTYFNVEIDGKTMDRIINPTPREFSNVNVYSGLNTPTYYIPPSDAVIRNLHYESITQTTTAEPSTGQVRK